ncbi:hypothetical protein ACWD4O_47070 [Streptomyces sp. NPDC002623]
MTGFFERMARRALGTEPRLVLQRGSRYEPLARAGEWRPPEDASLWAAPPPPAVDASPGAAVGVRAEGVPPPVGAAAAMPVGEAAAGAEATDAVPLPSSGPVDVPSGGEDRAVPLLRAGSAPAAAPAGGPRGEGRGRAGSDDTAHGGEDEAAAPGDEVSDAADVASPPDEPGNISRHAGTTSEQPRHSRSPHADTHPSGTSSPPPSSTAAPAVASVAGPSGTVGAGRRSVREPDFGQALDTAPAVSPDAADTHGGLRDTGRAPTAAGPSAGREGRRETERSGRGVGSAPSEERPADTRPPEPAPVTGGAALLNASAPASDPASDPLPGAPPAGAYRRARRQPVAKTDRSPGTEAPSATVRRPGEPSPGRRSAWLPPVPQAPWPEPASAAAPPRGEDTVPASPGRPVSQGGPEPSRSPMEADRPAPGQGPHRPEAERTHPAPSADTRTDPSREHRPQRQERAGADTRSPRPPRHSASRSAFPGSPSPADAGPSHRPEPATPGNPEPQSEHTAPDTVELVREHVVPALTERGVLPSSVRVEVRRAEAGEPAPAPRAGTATVRTAAARRTHSVHSADASGSPAVHLHIARIEVLPAAPPSPPTGSRVDLDAYLARRDKENP